MLQKKKSTPNVHTFLKHVTVHNLWATHGHWECCFVTSLECVPCCLYRLCEGKQQAFAASCMAEPSQKRGG